MIYDVHILRRAQKELGELPAGYYEAVRDAIRSLAEEPRPNGARKLKGRDGWRIRVGPYRVIYEMDARQRAVTIIEVGHRSAVYR